MTAADFHSSEADLDRMIEELIGKQVRGELTPAEDVLLVRLVARRARDMRPARARHYRWSPSVS